MKLTKSDLKAIVKECLIEVLSEGIGNSQLVESKNPQQRQRQPAVASRKFDPALDTPVATRQAPQPTFKTGNSIFDDILADTAKNTLPGMLQAEGAKQPAPTGKVEMLVEASTPEQLFGDEAASKWAMLAFSSSPKNS